MQMRSRHDDPSKNKLSIPEYQETVKQQQQQQQQKHLPLVFSTQPRMATTVHGMHQDNNFLPPQNQWNATDVLLHQNQSSFLSPTFPRQPVPEVKTTHFNHNDSSTRLPWTSQCTDSTTTNDQKNMPTAIAMVETTSPFMNNPLTNENQTFRRSDAMVDTNNNNNNKPTKSAIEASTSSLNANECRPGTTLTTMTVNSRRNETNSSVSDLNREELSQTTSYVGMKDSESIRDCLANGYSTIIGNKNNINHNDKCINHSNVIEMSTCSNIESIDGKESCATSCAEVSYITSNVTRDALTSVLSPTIHVNSAASICQTADAGTAPNSKMNSASLEDQVKSKIDTREVGINGMELSATALQKQPDSGFLCHPTPVLPSFGGYTTQHCYPYNPTLITPFAPIMYYPHPMALQTLFPFAPTHLYGMNGHPLVTGSSYGAGMTNYGYTPPHLYMPVTPMPQNSFVPTSKVVTDSKVITDVVTKQSLKKHCKTHNTNPQDCIPSSSLRLSLNVLQSPSPWAKSHVLLPESVTIYKLPGESFGITMQVATCTSHKVNEAFKLTTHATNTIANSSPASTVYTAMIVLDASKQNDRTTAITDNNLKHQVRKER
jgi:hypothetical protein